ncbi:MAG: hypothetical protein HY735_27935 [Verrucomicrobia bacterium]|nr:hypothetical protein [Verrucomicrobiota bacterium]
MKAHLSKSVVVLSASIALCSTGFAAVVYDNTAATNSLNRSFSAGNNIEFGDQIFLEGSDRRVTDFRFDYFLSTGSARAELFFYQNNGAGGTAPGTLLYRSGQFDLATGVQSIVAQGLSVSVGNTFTWAVAFSGVDLGEEAGLLLFSPPTIGASIDDFWVKDSAGNWSTFLIDAGATPANFAARVTAVPEPSTYALAVSMVLAWFGYRGYKRRSA